MIKKAIAIFLMFVFQQALASPSCPTCPKGYVVSSLEDTLLSKQNTKGFFNPQGVIKNLYSQKQPSKADYTKQFRRHSQPKLRSFAPKRDEIFDIAHSHQKISHPKDPCYASNDQGNGNLRGTFDTTMALNSKFQLQQQIHKSRK